MINSWINEHNKFKRKDIHKETSLDDHEWMNGKNA